MTMLEDTVSAFIATTQQENISFFAQGDVLAAGLEAGLTKRELFQACGRATGRSPRTIHNRYKTALVFPVDQRSEAIDWSIHMLCAETADLRQPETFQAARTLLDEAAAGCQTADGWRPHSFKSFRLLTAGRKPKVTDDSDGAPKLDYVIDSQPAAVLNAVTHPNGKMSLTLSFEHEFEVMGQVIVTIAQVQVLAQEMGTPVYAASNAVQAA